MENRTFGQIAADYAAAGIGSWAFIIVFNGIIALWVMVNTYSSHPLDAYPFTFLNLILSWLAGVQAPLIMISQNRQEEIQKKTVDDIATIGMATYEIGVAIKDMLEEQTELIEEQTDLLEDHIGIEKDTK